ncbi:YvrJ family protein [Jeotgalibaca sp. MA1X17-3]|uniref:YvrJ family protein n=1 Tax=Jeotgalibaca sp. MA1X17-3 TaxID=2908211 RepID=UPI001F226A66|nr:YvrJ family protein [Jeotgalibaca sp. MA1X17-3]UJF16412.1 YvrJ family protein [Jeotgalibaca sp. MA1X17-3]
MDPNVFSYIEAISNTGFPIVISLYLLNRMEKKVDALVSAIEKLSNTHSLIHKG